jgi:hypothetical protein
VCPDLKRWSLWIRTNDHTEVRMRTCIGSDEICNGTEAEVRHCDPESNRCDVKTASVMTEDDLVDDRVLDCGSGSGDGSGDDEGRC